MFSPTPNAIKAILFDVGDTLVVADAGHTPVGELTVSLRPQVVEDLKALAESGFRLGAVSDTAVMLEDDLRSFLEPSGISALFEVVVTSSDVGVTKPNPTSLNTAISRLNLKPNQVLYVGDRVIDAQAAEAAGTHFAFIRDTVKVTWERFLNPPFTTYLELQGSWQDHQNSYDQNAVDLLAKTAREHVDSLAKPLGSLGRVEDLGVTLTLIARQCPPPLPQPVAATVFAADHGVHEAGVTMWPQELTVAMAETMLSGRASINAFAHAVDATVSVVNVGMANGIPSQENNAPYRVRPGTRNLALEAAMTLAEATSAVEVGYQVAHQLIVNGANCLVTGEMGIANTTAAAAIIAAFTGHSAAEVAGRGAGADDATLTRKIEAIEQALTRHDLATPNVPSAHPLELLASLGGLEIAAMAGFVVAAAIHQKPVLIDGVIANAALLAAEALFPGVRQVAIAGHLSTEPAATIALQQLGLVPLLDLNLRLGEGTGAMLAVPLVQAAARLMNEVATIDELA